MSDKRCNLSVIIKCLNEGSNIARTLKSVIIATAGLDAEIVVADSLSTDDTVAIAGTFDVNIVQLANTSERSCGVAAQLGYQHAGGQFLLVMDGDMEVQRDWLIAALDHLAAHSDVAGVGGTIRDMNLQNIEFRARQQRYPRDAQPGEVDRLNGGGLFRREAIESVGYLTNRNLHACEELELALRLASAGWKMVRLDMISVLHHGHTQPMWALMRRRWQTRYTDGAGELLRASIGKPWFGRSLAHARLLLGVIAWWLTVLAALPLATFGAVSPFVPVVILIFPPVAMVRRKHSMVMGLYSILAWTFDAAGLLRGILQKQTPPDTAIFSRAIRPLSANP